MVNQFGRSRRQQRALLRSGFTRQRLGMFLCKENAGDLERLKDLIEAGSVTPSVERRASSAERRAPSAERTYPLADVPDAMRHLEAVKARGKVAVTI